VIEAEVPEETLGEGDVSSDGSPSALKLPVANRYASIVRVLKIRLAAGPGGAGFGARLNCRSGAETPFDAPTVGDLWLVFSKRENGNRNSESGEDYKRAHAKLPPEGALTVTTLSNCGVRSARAAEPSLDALINPMVNRVLTSPYLWWFDPF
jgi:hypothetical protein